MRKASIALLSLNHNLAVFLGLLNPLGNNLVEELDELKKQNDENPVLIEFRFK